MKKLSLVVLLLLPLVYLLVKVFYIEVNDPIKYIYTITGATAITLLFFTTTISMIRDYYNIVKYRKIFGLMGFFYASLHFLNFIILDMELDISFAFSETLDKPFIYLGMISFILLIFMAVTSTKELFKKYNRYHKVLYIILILVTIHYAMAQKSLSLLDYFFIFVMGIIAIFKVLQIKKRMEH